MPREILIQGGHVVTVDPSLGDLSTATCSSATASSLKSAPTLLRRHLTPR